MPENGWIIMSVELYGGVDSSNVLLMFAFLSIFMLPQGICLSEACANNMCMGFPSIYFILRGRFNYCCYFHISNLRSIAKYQMCMCMSDWWVCLCVCHLFSQSASANRFEFYFDKAKGSWNFACELSLVTSFYRGPYHRKIDKTISLFWCPSCLL